MLVHSDGFPHVLRMPTVTAHTGRRTYFIESRERNTHLALEALEGCASRCVATPLRQLHT